MNRRTLFLSLVLALGASGFAQVPRGTEVRLMLLKNLNSGGSVVGESVPFLVLEDIRGGGKVLIREGTFAVGIVRQARREGAFSATLFDKPARLAVELQQTWDSDGKPVRLLARLNGKQQELFHFNRDNTKPKPLHSPEAERALGTPATRKAVQLLVDTLKGSRSIQDVQNNAERNFIMAVARDLRLESTVDLLLNNRIMDLVSLGVKLNSPGFGPLSAASAAFGAARTTLKAVREIGTIACHMPGFLSRKFGGRNIDAKVGLEISVFAK